MAELHVYIYNAMWDKCFLAACQRTNWINCVVRASVFWACALGRWAVICCAVDVRVAPELLGCITEDCRGYILHAIQYTQYNFIIVNVYLPVNKELNEYKNCMSDIFTGISYVLDQYSDYSVIVAGDFNCDLIGDNIGCKLVAQFMTDRKLTCCDKWCNEDTKYTYCHASQDSRSFIDHFLVSNNLCSSVDSCEVVDSGVNLSDHLPVIVRISIAIPLSAASANKPSD